MSEDLVDPSKLTAVIDVMHDKFEAGEGPRPPSLWCPICSRKHRAAARNFGDEGPVIIWVCYEDKKAYEASADGLHAKKLLIHPLPIDLISK